MNQNTSHGIKSKFRFFAKNKILWLTVIIPTILASIYFGLIASDVYISESRFVVRSPQRQTQTGLNIPCRHGFFSLAR
jgi:capsular polysaccharide transport system permease protein